MISQTLFGYKVRAPQIDCKQPPSTWVSGRLLALSSSTCVVKQENCRRFHVNNAYNHSEGLCYGDKLKSI